MCAKKNNKGFSLIEMIVAMAVMAIVGACIYAFVSTSTKSYNSVSKDVDLQEEAQLAMNQLTSIIMNAQNGAYFDTASQTLYIYNSENCYVIAKGSTAASQDEHSLYYSVQSRSKDPNTGEYVNGFDAATEAPALMAEYLTNFDVLIDDTGSTTVATVTMEFEKSKNIYTTTQNVSLRNTIKLSDNLDAVYAENLGANVTPTYSGITVGIGSRTYSTVATGAHEVILTDSGDLTLPLLVQILGNNFPSQSYKVTLAGSRVSDGAELSRWDEDSKSVIISKDEEASNLTLTVIASAWPSLQCIVGINVKKITGITIKDNIANPESAFRLGSEIALGTSATSQLYATVDGTGNLSEDDRKITWVAGQNCSISGNTLTITTDESKIGQSFTVTATAQSGKTATYSGTITARSTNLLLTSDFAKADRGGSIQFTATDGENVYPQKDVTYSFSVSGGTSEDMFTLSKDGKLTVAKALDYSKEYTVTVTAALSYMTSVTQSVTVTVPAVALEYSLSENGVYSKKITVPVRNLTTAAGSNTCTVYYRVTGIKDGKLSDVAWTQWNSSKETFADTVTIGTSTITFTKVDKTYDGAVYQYDNTYYWLEGIPTVGGVALKDSQISVNNNYGNISVSINENNGGYKNYSYYIPAEVTNGYVTLAGTNVQYMVEYIQNGNNKYWKLTFKETNSMKYGRTTYTNYGGDWNQS